MADIDRLESLLKLEAKYLRAGNIEELESIQEIKSALVSSTSFSHDADAESLRRIRKQALENAHLFAAAGRGIRAALRQVSEIRSSPLLSTYTRDGARLDIARDTPTLTQKF